LFTSAKDMKDAISRIVTDSRAPGEAKDPDNSHLFTLYQAFATQAQEEEFRGELLQGLGWGEAKNRLFQLLDGQLGEARERYHQLMSRPSDMEDLLLVGARKARAVAAPFLAELREAVGLRSFVNPVAVAATTKKKAAKAARFVSFREDDGSFRFRLLAAEGEQLLLSRNFADGKTAGAVTKQLQSGQALDVRSEASSFSVWLDGEVVADSPAFADSASRDAAIEALRVALTPIED
jgi:tryptophanyl-tRNA synthetase